MRKPRPGELGYDPADASDDEPASPQALMGGTLNPPDRGSFQVSAARRTRLNILRPRRPTASLPYRVTTSPSRYLTTSSPRHRTNSPPYHHPTTALLKNVETPSGTWERDLTPVEDGSDLAPQTDANKGTSSPSSGPLASSQTFQPNAISSVAGPEGAASAATTNATNVLPSIEELAERHSNRNTTDKPAPGEPTGLPGKAAKRQSVKHTLESTGAPSFGNLRKVGNPKRSSLRERPPPTKLPRSGSAHSRRGGGGGSFAGHDEGTGGGLVSMLGNVTKIGARALLLRTGSKIKPDWGEDWCDDEPVETLDGSMAQRPKGPRRNSTLTSRTGAVATLTNGAGSHTAHWFPLPDHRLAHRPPRTTHLVQCTTRHMPHATRHAPRTTHHASHTTHHTPHATHHAPVPQRTRCFHMRARACVVLTGRTSPSSSSPLLAAGARPAPSRIRSHSHGR